MVWRGLFAVSFVRSPFAVRRSPFVVVVAFVRCVRCNVAVLQCCSVAVLLQGSYSVAVWHFCGVVAVLIQCCSVAVSFCCCVADSLLVFVVVLLVVVALCFALT